MSVKPIIPSIDSNNNRKGKVKINASPSYGAAISSNHPSSKVSFGGINPIVGLMDLIALGGYPVAFILQDGVGFIIPRVGKGLLRGGVAKDKDGNVITDKNGKPKRELNWSMARKEFIREIITGPSAFLIPLAMLSFISKKFGTGNKVKLNYLDSFKAPFAEFIQDNAADIKGVYANKKEFYKKIFEDVVENSINKHIPDAEKMSAEEISKICDEFAQKQIQIENVMIDKHLNKKQRKEKLAQIGTVEDDFMKLKKNKIGGAVNEMQAEFKSSAGKIKSGSITELLSSMRDYFSDATNYAIKNISDISPTTLVEKFTNRRMGSRILTNLGIFASVALFFFQIPKLYNFGLKSNPALKGSVADGAEKSQTANNTANNTNNTGVKTDNKTDKSNIAFGSAGGLLEHLGSKVFSGKSLKPLSDIFELEGSSISGRAMPILLYGFCIPPRLFDAQDKYDYGEIGIRDLSAFTALLFGAKAIARLFSDGFTKLTGLALNKKDLKGRNIIGKIMDYLNPNDTRHSVLSSKQLHSKYTNLEDYKGRVNGFVEFIEQSGGNIKKVFNYDKDIKEVVDNIVKEFGNGKSLKEATAQEIKDALKAADAAVDKKLITKFYELFKKENGILNRAKTCNSSFGFLSTVALVPLFIIWLTNICEKMTAKRMKKDLEKTQTIENAAQKNQNSNSRRFVASQTPTMAGFVGK